MDTEFEIFFATAPGLEQVLAEEATALGFVTPEILKGGVATRGGWPDVWRANLQLRGANRVLARIGSFRTMHLAQLDKRMRKFPWGDVLRVDVPVKVEVMCKKSRIYHAGAAAQRVERAITEEHGAEISKDAALKIMIRIEDDLCTISIDTSGELLHKRGHKVAVGKAPMRDTLASLFLRQCGYDGQEPVYDPMCGSGTFLIEAAEIAGGLNPGRTRAFGFEQLQTFDADEWAAIKAIDTTRASDQRFYGSDRDAGAVRMSTENAERAGVDGACTFEALAFADVQAPDGPKGLVMVNPPYGARIGSKKTLYPVYAQLGTMLKERFKGWRVGVVTSDASLANTMGLKFLEQTRPVSNGGLKVSLYRTGRL
ncbi:MAG: putative N6-adenine-specific DNA methylase [Ascidiaceihabitans sp.]|jgi:putative N6-adenine-specific DNA methylase